MVRYEKFELSDFICCTTGVYALCGSLLDNASSTSAFTPAFLTSAIAVALPPRRASGVSFEMSSAPCASPFSFLM